MPANIQTILTQLAAVTETSSQSDLKALVAAIADNQADPALHSNLSSLLTRPGNDTACQLFGLLPGHAGQQQGERVPAQAAQEHHGNRSVVQKHAGQRHAIHLLS